MTEREVQFYARILVFLEGAKVDKFDEDDEVSEGANLEIDCFCWYRPNTGALAVREELPDILDEDGCLKEPVVGLSSLLDLSSHISVNTQYSPILALLNDSDWQAVDASSMAVLADEATDLLRLSFKDASPQVKAMLENQRVFCAGFMTNWLVRLVMSDLDPGIRIDEFTCLGALAIEEDKDEEAR